MIRREIVLDAKKDLISQVIEKLQNYARHTSYMEFFIHKYLYRMWRGFLNEFLHVDHLSECKKGWDYDKLDT